MRTVEGKGRIPPTPLTIVLEDSDLALARSIRDERMRYRNYNGRSDQWGKGLIDGGMAVLTGLVGEIAVCKWLRYQVGHHCEIDDRPKPYGDRGIDFSVGCFNMQVKTATKTYRETLVRTSDSCHKKWNLLIRAQWPAYESHERRSGFFGDEKICNYLTCDLCGWIHGIDFDRLCSIVPARIGEHNNYSLESKYLSPMKDLELLLVARKEYYANCNC